jgi:peptidoglycan/LPS O-acetylase OafA/YrhL
VQGPGVLLFFAISGFIIASQFLVNSAHPFSAKFLGPYYLRRVTRIEPPYFLVLVGTFLLIAATGYIPRASTTADPDSSLTASLFASLFYAHDLLYGHWPRLFPPGWSLEIEVQFYVFAPAFFYLYFVRVPANRKWLMGLLIAAAAIAFSGWVGSFENPHLQLTLLRFFPFFWIGIIMAAANQTWRAAFAGVPSRILSAAAWAALPIFVGFSFLTGKAQITADVSLAGSVISIAVMFIGALSDGSFRRFCANSWISLLGGACYSIYLTHLQTSQIMTHAIFSLSTVGRLPWAVQLLLAYMVEIPCICAVGLTFYALVERPFMVPNWPKAAIQKLAHRFGPAQTNK